MATTETPRVLVGMIHLYVFQTGDAEEVGIQYENLGPLHLIQILLKVLKEFIAYQFESKSIVAPEAPIPEEDRK